MFSFANRVLTKASKIFFLRFICDYLLDLSQNVCDNKLDGQLRYSGFNIIYIFFQRVSRMNSDIICVKPGQRPYKIKIIQT